MIKHIRVYNYKEKIWIAIPETPTKNISNDTILNIRDAHGNTEQVFAEQVSIDQIYYHNT